MLQADDELRALLRALPTRTDMEALISKLEATHCKEMAVVKNDVKALADRMDAGESLVIDLQQVMVVETQQAAQVASATNLQLYFEELEDRGRCNNLQI